MPYNSKMTQKDAYGLTNSVDPNQTHSADLGLHCLLWFINRKTPKISDARKLSCNTPKIQIIGPNLMVFLQKNANGIANSGDPDQTAPLGAV